MPIDTVHACAPVLDFLQQARAEMFAGRLDTRVMAPDLRDFESTSPRATA